MTEAILSIKEIYTHTYNEMDNELFLPKTQ